MHYEQDDTLPASENDVVDGRYHLTKPEDPVSGWLDEVKRQVRTVIREMKMMTLQTIDQQHFDQDVRQIKAQVSTVLKNGVCCHDLNAGD